MRSVPLVLLLALLLVCLPVTASAQLCADNDPCPTNRAPHLSISVQPRATDNPTLMLSIFASDDESLAMLSWQLWYNGVLSTWIGNPGVIDDAGSLHMSVSATGPFQLTNGTYALISRICDAQAPSLCAADTVMVTYTPPPPPPPQADPVVTLAQRSDARDIDAGGATYDYVTPAYVSLNTPRGVTLHYSSEAAEARRVVQVDATIRSGQIPERVSIQIGRFDGTLTWPEAFFKGDTGSVRLAARVNDACVGVSVCATKYSVTVRAYYSASAVRQTTVTVRLLQEDARTSRYGAGWTVAGIERLYAQSDGVVVSNGAGGLQFFEKLSCPLVEICEYSSPVGNGSTLNRTLAHPLYGTRYVLAWPSGDSTFFDDAGLPRRVKARFASDVTRLAWSADALGARLDTIIDPMQKATRLSYESVQGGSAYAPGSLRFIDLPDIRRVTVLVSAPANDLTRIEGPDGFADWQATYEATTHRVLSYVERLGGSSVAYDANGQVTKVSGIAVPLESGGMGADSVVIAPLVSKALAGSFGTYAEATVTTPLRVDSAFVRVVQSNGLTSTLWPHRSGAAAKALSRAANGDSTSSAVTFNALDLPTAVLTVGQAPITYSYDVTGRRVYTVTQGLTEQTTTYTYGPFDQVQAVFVNNVKMSEAFFSGAGLAPDSVRSDTANTVRFKYDAYGRVRAVRNVRQELDSATYDDGLLGNTATRLSVVPNEAPRVTTFSYDPSGRPVQVTDHLSRVYTTQYDLMNRVTRQVARGADTARYTYAELLRSAQFIDPQGNTYTTQLNAAGWVISSTDPRAGIGTRGYDRRGNVVRATDRRGQVVRWFKDLQDRDTLRIAGADTTRYAYDPNNRWVAVRNAESTDTLVVDAAGRPTSATTVRGSYRYVLSQGWEGTQAGELNIRAYLGANTNALWSRMSGSGYDGMRREALLQDFGGKVTTTTFDATERARTVALPNAITVRSNGYNARGALTNETYSGGAASFTRAHWRDNADRIVATVLDGPPIAGADPSYPAINQFQRGHDYNSSDRLAGWRDIRSYEYTTTEWIPWDPYNDCPGCMILESTSHAGVDTLRAAAYTYDQLGNRTGAGITYQAGGGSRLAQMNGETFTYDAEGNLTQRTGATGTSTYTWDALGQLRTVVTPQGTTTYGYDGLGQRVRKTVNGWAETQYLLDAGQVVMELAPGGVITAEYTYYPGTDRPHGMRRGGTQYYYTQDAQGNVTGLVTANGSVAETYEYAPYGEMIAATGSVANPYRYKGREWDAEAGLYFMRARYYDPTIGRFLSEDPIGLAGGANPYAFVGGDPVNRADPSGTRCVEMGLFRIWSTAEGEEISRQLLYSWWEGDCGGGGGRERPGLSGPSGQTQGAYYPMSADDKKRVLKAIRALLRNPACREAGRLAYSYFPDSIFMMTATPRGDGYVAGESPPGLIVVSDLAVNPQSYGYPQGTNFLQGIVAHEAGHKYLLLPADVLKRHRDWGTDVVKKGFPLDTVQRLGINCGGAP